MMPKRYTDTEIWDRTYFRRLPLEVKLLWQFIRDRCDAAGVWQGDFEDASFKIGSEVSEKTIESHPEMFAERLQKLDNGKWLVVGLVEFQYRNLSWTNTAHLGVLRLLDKHGLIERYKTLIRDYEGALKALDKPYQGLKHKGTGTGTDKGTGTGTEKAKREGTRRHGEHVFLFDAEVEKLTKRLGDPRRTENVIEILDNYLGESDRNRKKYTNHYRVILNWCIEKLVRQEKAGVLTYSKRPPSSRTEPCPHCHEQIAEGTLLSHYVVGICKAAKPASKETIRQARAEIEGLIETLQSPTRRKKL